MILQIIGTIAAWIAIGETCLSVAATFSLAAATTIPRLHAWSVLEWFILHQKMGKILFPLLYVFLALVEYSKETMWRKTNIPVFLLTGSLMLIVQQQNLLIIGLGLSLEVWTVALYTCLLIEHPRDDRDNEDTDPDAPSPTGDAVERFVRSLIRTGGHE